MRHCRVDCGVPFSTLTALPCHMDLSPPALISWKPCEKALDPWTCGVKEDFIDFYATNKSTGAAQSSVFVPFGKLKKDSFPDRDSNPGRSGESNNKLTINKWQIVIKISLSPRRKQFPDLCSSNSHQSHIFNREQQLMSTDLELGLQAIHGCSHSSGHTVRQTSCQNECPPGPKPRRLLRELDWHGPTLTHIENLQTVNWRQIILSLVMMF